MPRIQCKPSGVDFTTPGRRDYFVRFEHPTLWGFRLVPVTVLVGPQAQPGRGVLCNGSTHGDEFEGPVAIKDLMQSIRLDDVLGRMVLIPTLNVAAFNAATRDTPDDGKNLNRCFPGNQLGTITEKFAHFITTQVFSQVHTVFDLHAGGNVARFARCLSFHRVPNLEQQRAMEQAGRAFGSPFVMLYQDETPGLLTSCAERLGKITLGAELGWGQAISREGVGMARQGLLTALIAQEQLRGTMPENQFTPRDQQVLVDASDLNCYVTAHFAGWFEPCVDLGQKVAKGTLVARLHDFDQIDATPQEVRAPHDGYITTQAWKAKVERGQVITVVAPQAEWLS